MQNKAVSMSIFIACSCLFIACSQNDDSGVAINASSQYSQAEVSLSSIDFGELLPIDGEGFPFVWQNQLMYLSAPRGSDDQGAPHFNLYNGLFTIYTGPANVSFISGIVSNGKLYVFGSDQIFTGPEKSTGQNHLVVTYTSDLVSWSVPQIVFTSDVGAPFFNSSVAQNDQGFVIALEENIPNLGVYSFKVSESANLLGGWSTPGKWFSSTTYSACPTIRYANGTYYAFYLHVLREGTPSMKYVTIVSRSLDLMNWHNNI